MFVAQPDHAVAAASAAIPSEPWRLGAVNVITTLTGSALIALAVSQGRLTSDDAWTAAHVDEDWNMNRNGAATSSRSPPRDAFCRDAGGGEGSGVGRLVVAHSCWSENQFHLWAL